MAGNNRKKTASRNNKGSTNKTKSSQRATRKKTASKKSSNKRQVVEDRGGFWNENKYELIFILISVVSIVLLLSNFHLVGPVGEGLNRILFGMIGVITWIFPIYVFFASIFLLANVGSRKIRNKVLAAAALLLAFGGIFELISYGDLRNTAWGSLYTMSAENKNGGGFLGGVLAKVLNVGLAQVGAYIILAAIIIILVIYLTGKMITSAINDRVNETKETLAEYKNEAMLDARAKADKKIARRRELREIRRIEREKLREARALEDERLRQEEIDRKRALSEELIQERIKANIENRVKSGPNVENIVKYDDDNRNEADKIEVKAEEETRDNIPLNAIKDINKEVELKEISKAEKEQLSFLIHRANDDIKDGENEEEPFYLKEIESKFGNEKNTGNEENNNNSDEIISAGISNDVVSEENPEPKENLRQSESENYEGDYFPETENYKTVIENEQAEDISFDDEINEYENLLDEEEFDEDFSDEDDNGEETEEDKSQKSILEIEKERLLEKKTIIGNKALESSFGDSVTPGVQTSTDITGISERRDNMGAHNKKYDDIESLIPEIPVVNPPEPPKPYVFPPKSLLSKASGDEEGISDEELHETARKLQETLAAFGVNVKVTDVSCGPTVTRYELQPEQGVKVSRITALTDDIKLNLAAADIRIEAPIPGKAAVGIEVPNKKNLMVHFRDLIENKAFDEHQSKLVFAVGKDIGGQTMISDIAKMPHLLIAGATGSGKSVCINTLIMSILYKAKPNEVKLIMVDPKVVELSVYNGIPHLMLPVVTDPKKAAAALNWAVVEMKRRYDLFAEKGVREIKGFNKKVGKESPEWMPQIVIIVDELADLMMVSSKEVEESICRLAQLARAAGIHLVIATQRPSVNVITGLIKANVPSRVAFAVSSQVDSRTILDGAGAEKLLGKGDMLFFPSGYPKPVRVQGAFISDSEVSSVVEFIKSNNDPAHKASDITEQVNAVTQPENVKEGNSASSEDDAYDEYFDQAGRLIIDKDKASIGMLQRVYRIGFNRAARIMDQLAEAGVVGEEDGTKPRKILMNKEDFEDFIAARHGE